MRRRVGFKPLWMVWALALFIAPWSWAETPQAPQKPAAEQQYFQEVANRWITTAQQENAIPAVLKGGVDMTDIPYRLGPGDTIEISIPYINTDPFEPARDPAKDAVRVTVRDNQSVSIPPFGAFRIEGMTVPQLTRMLEEMAQYYLVRPRVYIQVANTRPFTVYVTGNVLRPGAYQVSDDPALPNSKDWNRIEDQPEQQTFFEPRVSYLIAKAGGLHATADVSHIEVKQHQTGQTRTVDLLALLHGDPSQDLLLSANDTVHIPTAPGQRILPVEASEATFGPHQYVVHVFGHITKSANGVTDITLDSRSMTVISALSKVNIDTRANLKKVLVLRKHPHANTFNTYPVDAFNADFALLPNDIVLIAKKKPSARMYSALQIMSQMIWSGTAAIRAF